VAPAPSEEIGLRREHSYQFHRQNLLSALAGRQWKIMRARDGDAALAGIDLPDTRSAKKTFVLGGNRV